MVDAAGTPQELGTSRAAVRMRGLRFVRRNPTLIVGLLILSLMLVCALAAPWIGGDPYSSLRRNAVVRVDANGLDAIVIGTVFIALGVINLSIGIRDRRRIPVFWTGAALLGTTVIYGLVRAVMLLP